MDGQINPNKAGFTKAIEPSTSPASIEQDPVGVAIGLQYGANLNAGAKAGKTFN